ncbi:MAG TPA: DUF4442 domain-containing protein [Ramlibacter sp.]
MPRSIVTSRPSVLKAVLNLWPPYWGTGIRVVSVSQDWLRMRVEMRRHFYNVNAFGTHFGGSLYAMCDPHLALLLVRHLGAQYVVWDKAASIEFVAPGRGTVGAEFEWSPAELECIRQKTADGARFEPEKTVEVTDDRGCLIARVRKTLYVRRRKTG